jgi:pilus assembly protein Flp/PilA
MNKIVEKFRKNKKRAQSLVEYGLILALVAVIAIAALQVLGTKIQQASTTAGNTVTDAATNAAEAYCQSLTPPKSAVNGVCQ